MEKLTALAPILWVVPILIAALCYKFVLRFFWGIRYFRDGRTNKCFAAVNSLGHGGLVTTSIACVLCDSMVRAQIVKDSLSQ